MSFKKLVRKVFPLDSVDLYRKIKSKILFKSEQKETVKNIFTTIYNTEYWKNKESVSGPGSSIEQTKQVRLGIQDFVIQNKIKKILDIPCGDYHWMKHTILEDVEYIGADIVSELIAKNNEDYKDDKVAFVEKNLLSDELPASDLIICRDCLVHFSYKDIKEAILNLKKSSATYVLLTTFREHKFNYDIKTGEWRPINLEKSPFNFPKPILYIEEYCEQRFAKEFKKKSLGVWKLSDINEK